MLNRSESSAFASFLTTSDPRFSSFQSISSSLPPIKKEKLKKYRVEVTPDRLTFKERKRSTIKSYCRFPQLSRKDSLLTSLTSTIVYQSDLPVNPREWRKDQVETKVKSLLNKSFKAKGQLLRWYSLVTE